MPDLIDGDTYEGNLIKEKTKPFNYLLPQALPEVDEMVASAMRAEQLDPRKYTSAYANNVLWTLRRYIEENPLDGWALKGRRDCLHLVDKSSGLLVKITKSFAFTRSLAPAGPNAARRRTYMQGEFRTEDEMMQLFGGVSLEGDVVHIAWTKDNGEFSFMAYVPKEAGSFPRSPEARLAYSIGIDESEYDGLSFEAKAEPPMLVPMRNLLIEHAPVDGSEKKNMVVE